MCGGAVDLNKVELTNRETIIHRRSYTRIALSTAVVRLRWLYRVESIHDNYRMLFSFPFYFFPLFFFFFSKADLRHRSRDHGREYFSPSQAVSLRFYDETMAIQVVCFEATRLCGTHGGIYVI